MKSALASPSHVGGMLRNRRIIGSLLLIAIAILTISYLRQPEQLIEAPLTGTQPNEAPLTKKPPPINTPIDYTAHPIHQLVNQAQGDFSKLLARQSKSLSEAVAEYRKRYRIPPPPHFDKWFEFAQARGVQLIDEYDTIHNSLLPFWALEPSVIRERTREAIGFDNALISVMIRNGRVVKSDGGGDMYKWHRDATPGMLSDFIKYLPDMDLAFNIHDEPRVVMQHDDLLRHVTVAKDQNMPLAFQNQAPRNEWSSPGDDLGDGIRIKEYKITRFNRFAHQPTWSNSRLSCPPDSAARSCLNDSCSDNIAAYSNQPLGFISNTTAFSDVCNSPSFEKSVGFFVCPNAFDVTHDLVPIFSQSKVSSFQDILYPSPWYFKKKVKYDAGRDLEWDAKAPNMYWRGSTTGGFSRNGGWRRQHRQRFLTKIQPFGSTRILSRDNSTNSELWHETEVSMQDMAHYFDVKLTYIGQCDPGDCDAQREYFGTVEPVNMFDALGYKYLLDIDGNAFSGRYYAWLLSNSLVYKLAVFREWHDEWIKPWIHYVPLGTVGDEYVESIRYFDQEEEGKIEAQRIANEAKSWAQKVLRNEDLEVWYFRLLLEYGRLIDDNRADIGFSL